MPFAAHQAQRLVAQRRHVLDVDRHLLLLPLPALAALDLRRGPQGGDLRGRGEQDGDIGAARHLDLARVRVVLQGDRVAAARLGRDRVPARVLGVEYPRRAERVGAEGDGTGIRLG